MYINISYKFHRIPDTQFHFITKVNNLLGQPSYKFIFMYIFIVIAKYETIILAVSISCGKKITTNVIKAVTLSQSYITQLPSLFVNA